MKNNEKHNNETYSKGKPFLMFLGYNYLNKCPNNTNNRNYI